MKKVSVIITTFNAAATIERLIDSIKNQEDFNINFEIEWLVFDDCSTDNTQEILKKNHIPFSVNEVNSGGPNKGRNLGLEKASGDFITIADHDDEWYSDKIKTLLNYGNQAEIITSGFTIIDELEEQLFVRSKQCDDGFQFYEKNETFRQILQRTYQGQTTYLGSIFFNRNISAPKFEEIYGKADYDWVLKLFYNRSSLEVCAPLYNRYVEGGNLSLDETYRLQEREISIQAIEEFQPKFPKLAEAGIKNTNGTLAKFYYSIEQMPKARKYFRKSKFTLKNLLYYLTSFAGYKFVNKYFKVFG